MESRQLVGWNDGAAPSKSPLIEGLHVIYEMENLLILVLPDLAPGEIADRITGVDWREVATSVSGRYRGLRITTSSQLRLILQLDTAADLRLRSYSHAWGLDPLDNLEAAHWRVLRHLGRLPSEIELVGLPHGYISAEDATFPCSFTTCRTGC